MGQTLVILDPSGIPPPIEKVRPAARPASHEGPSLGPSRQHETKLRQAAPPSGGALERDAYPISSFTHYRKGGSALPLEEDLIDRMAAKSATSW